MNCSELKCRLYCLARHWAKKILGRESLTAGKILDTSSVRLGTPDEVETDLWQHFIASSVVATGEFAGFHYGGYIAESKEWCLPSWIWTNAAIVRMFSVTDRLDKAKTLVERLAERQQPCGGWIVRNDYDKQGAIPMLAPNDSAYIANNAFVELYLRTGERKYLDVAVRCADWIIETARPDGMVYVGYNMREQKWDRNCVIVDVGFTAGLFSRLYEITREEEYLNFLRNFTGRYIDLFYDTARNGFCTSIDKNDRQQGGMFGRGQAWALEGLIPAYKVLKDERIRQVIDNTVNNLIRMQHKSGGWAYNFAEPLMGEDCKGISVIAKDMMDWYKVTGDKCIRKSAEKALEWCRIHTSIEGNAKGGIFSFSMEGAIVRELYTSCAFVYSSSYAIELYQMLGNE